MNLLTLAEGWGEALVSKPFGLAADRCLHAVDKFATCTACYDLCPAEAIQLEKPPTFAGESCQGCRACLPACPVGAFTADDEVRAMLNCVQQLGVKTCELVCGLNPNVAVGDPAAAAAVRVRGCLAGLGVGAYMALVSRGLETVVVRLDACAGCPWRQLRPRAAAQVQQAQDLLALWGQAKVLTCLEKVAANFRKRPFWEATSPPISRRGLFHWWAVEPKPAAEPGAAAEPNPFHERLRFLQAVKTLPPPSEQAKTTSLAGLGFALAAVNDDCTACGVCARVCPTGALHLETSESGYRLTFSPQTCLACDICSHVCAPKAITLTHNPTFDQVFGLAGDQIVQQGSLATCSKCHTSFAARAGTKLCPVCEFRRQNPFGSATPPGLAVNRMKQGLAGVRRISL